MTDRTERMWSQMQIHPKFSKLLRPLSDDERTTLEASIAKIGCYAPLETWQGYLIGGHHRKEICDRLGQSYKVVDRTADFETETDVIEYIYSDQMGRRNLDFADLKTYIGELYQLRKKRLNDEANKGTYSDKVGGGQNVHQGKTAEQIGAEYGINERTVRRYGQQVAKMGYEAKQSNGDEYDQSMPEEGFYDEGFDELAQDVPADDFNQGEPTPEQRQEAKAASPFKRPKSKSKGILTQQKGLLRTYETLLGKMQGLRLDVHFDNSLMIPEFKLLFESIEAQRAKFPVPKKKFGR